MAQLAGQGVTGKSLGPASMAPVIGSNNTQGVDVTIRAHILPSCVKCESVEAA
ncbi:hypothetical protein [Arthrobacter dokdonensis]|uniref:hypothetical protein n=1 Tax=Arthrobacter dokdonellae TaxID=2211210 RepID=UPI0014942BD4|nr:hypothetical protein [Arthrobacter dokdonellae]